MSMSTEQQSNPKSDAEERGYYKVSLNADVDKRHLLGEDRTAAQRAAETDPSRNETRVEQWELAWELNRLNRQYPYVVRQQDITNDSVHGKTIYGKRFKNFREAQRKANIMPPIDHVVAAIKSYVQNGNSYGTTKKLKEHMYPMYDTSDMGSDFGLGRQYDGMSIAPSKKQDIVDEWEYPKISTNRISHALGDIHKMDGSYRGINVDVWSNTGNKTYYFTVAEDNND